MTVPFLPLGLALLKHDFFMDDTIHAVLMCQFWCSICYDDVFLGLEGLVL